VARGGAFHRATFSRAGGGGAGGGGGELSAAWTTAALPERIRASAQWPLLFDVHAERGLLIARDDERDAKHSIVAVSLASGENAFAVEVHGNAPTGILALPATALYAADFRGAEAHEAHFVVTSKSSAVFFTRKGPFAHLLGHKQDDARAFVRREGEMGSTQGTSCCIAASAYLPSSHSIALTTTCGAGRGFPVVAYQIERKR